MTADPANQILATAFAEFNQLSVQLEQSYRELQARVVELSAELAAARSERLQQLMEKERLADRLQTLLSALPAGVLVLDGQGRIRECNRVAEMQLGQPLIGELWDCLCQQRFAQAPNQAGEILLHDGRRLSLARRALDTEPGYILVLHDSSEIYALQEAVNRQQRLGAMGEMAASLAHQIRTPLSAAVLYGGHLAKDHLPAGDRARFAQRLSERLRHLERLVNDMLTFARGGRGGEEAFSLDQLMNELRQALETPLQSADADWLLCNEVGAANLRGNKDALLGALSNLVINSLQICQSKTPVIHVRLTRLGADRLEIRLRDNGPGIPTELHERIFEPFYTTRPGGTGLGLAVVQATLRAHGGQVSVESPAEGGAEFVIQLPEVNAISPQRDNAADVKRFNVACGIN